MPHSMDKKDLRIIYMGTPDFAVASFAALVENGYNVVACITMPDKPAGRGHHMQFSPVKEYALQHAIPVLQPERLKDEVFLEELRSYKADLQIVVAFRMLPEVVWNMPRLGTFNLHASLLPQYRGAAPINWAVINGDKETGITTFFLKHEIDTGNLILQQKIVIGDDENVGSVHDRLMELGSDLVLKTVDLIIDSETTGVPVKTTPQDESIELRPAPKIFKETCQIDFGKTSAKVHNFVRGLSPYPAAWCNLTIGEKQFDNVKVYAVRPSEGGTPLSVKTADGYVDILELQVPGKKRMAARDFLNGIR